ncbi:MAG: hypothetical protein JWQ48_724, partial [Conexibacter sp.]|nr:hypothetical protein [Conexibacter sp.]
MSGLFQRIARRRAEDPDEAAAPTTATQLTEEDGADVGLPAANGDAASATSDGSDASQTAVTPPTEQPTDAQTQQLDALAPSDGAATSLWRTSPAPAAIPATPAEAPPSPPGETPPADATPPEQPESPKDRRAGFRERGKMRRRLRYLRKVRELQVRDLGGLAFDLRRFERKRDDLVAQKIDQIRASDDELRALEQVLDERRELRDVREPGIGGTCPRCFALFGSADRFCSHCGAALGGAVQGPAQVPGRPAPAPAPQPSAHQHQPQPSASAHQHQHQPPTSAHQHQHQHQHQPLP